MSDCICPDFDTGWLMMIADHALVPFQTTYHTARNMLSSYLKYEISDEVMCEVLDRWGGWLEDRKPGEPVPARASSTTKTVEEPGNDRW